MHFYRTPLVWVRGEGLCSAKPVGNAPRLRHWLIVSGLATTHFIDPYGVPMIHDPTMRAHLISAPESEPLSVSDAKAFLRIEHSADDAVIIRAITAARQAAEEHLRMVLLPQSWQFTSGELCHVLALPKGPAQSVSSVKSVDAEGIETTLSTDRYRLSVDGFAIIFHTMPAGVRLIVNYEAYLAEEASDVPALITQGMLHHVAAMLEQREGVVPMPVLSRQCYQPYRRVSL